MITRTFFCISLGIFILIQACATGALHVSTSPTDAEIFVVDSTGDSSPLGKTPKTIGLLGLDRAAKGYVHLLVKKPGFQTESLIIPTAKLPSEIHASFRLKTIEKDSRITEDSFRELASGVAEVQQLITGKKYAEAESRLQTLTTKFPQVSILFDLLGNVYYLQRDLDKALIAYKKSLEFWPHNVQTARMVEKISSIRGR